MQSPTPQKEKPLEMLQAGDCLESRCAERRLSNTILPKFPLNS